MKNVIKVPFVPNFIICNGVARPIADYDEEALREIGKAMTENLILKLVKRNPIKEITL